MRSKREQQWSSLMPAGPVWARVIYGVWHQDTKDWELAVEDALIVAWNVLVTLDDEGNPWAYHQTMPVYAGLNWQEVGNPHKVVVGSPNGQWLAITDTLFEPIPTGEHGKWLGVPPAATFDEIKAMFLQYLRDRELEDAKPHRTSNPEI